MSARSSAAVAPEVRQRQRASLVVGLLLLAVGVGLVGWTAWQFWGTTYVSQRSQEAVVSQLERQWDAAGPAQVRTDAGVAGAVIRIPRFGADYAVPVVDGTSDAALASGFGHFDGSAGPGEVGNFALAAHRITHGEPLRRMFDLQVGDEIIVETSSTIYTYALTTAGDDLTVPFSQTWVVAPAPVNPDPGGVRPEGGPDARLLTLTTCAELFHTDQRSIAFAVLVASRPRI